MVTRGRREAVAIDAAALCERLEAVKLASPFDAVEAAPQREATSRRSRPSASSSASRSPPLLERRRSPGARGRSPRRRVERGLLRDRRTTPLRSLRPARDARRSRDEGAWRSPQPPPKTKPVASANRAQPPGIEPRRPLTYTVFVVQHDLPDGAYAQLKRRVHMLFATQDKELTREYRNSVQIRGVGIYQIQRLVMRECMAILTGFQLSVRGMDLFVEHRRAPAEKSAAVGGRRRSKRQRADLADTTLGSPRPVESWPALPSLPGTTVCPKMAARPLLPPPPPAPKWLSLFSESFPSQTSLPRPPRAVFSGGPQKKKLRSTPAPSPRAPAVPTLSTSSAPPAPRQPIQLEELVPGPASCSDLRAELGRVVFHLHF